MNRTPFLGALIAALTTVSYAHATLIQFGGDAAVIADSNYQSQVGASQIIQWNGLNSGGGSFGSAGTLAGLTGPPASPTAVGATLTSLGGENLVLTSLAVTGGTGTFAAGTPNVLGVFGNDNAKFDSGNNESWTFELNQDVVLKHLVFSALNFAGETIQLTLEGGVPVSFNRGDALMSPVTYGAAANRYVYSLAGGGLSVSAGQDISLASSQGVWGLQAVVVEASVIPEPAALVTLLMFASAGLVAAEWRRA